MIVTYNRIPDNFCTDSNGQSIEKTFRLDLDLHVIPLNNKITAYPMAKDG